MPRVYVIGALIQRGGTYMAYHIGRMVQEEFGYELINVEIRPPAPEMLFSYPYVPPTMNVQAMEAQVTQHDLLVINPSFSHFMFGLRLPGRKICYVQGFQSFNILDCRCDLYVTAGTMLQQFLAGLYGLESVVIPPFLQWERLPDALPWRERPPGSMLMYVKRGEENAIAAEYALNAIARLPGLNIQQIRGNSLPYQEFMRRMAAVRYLISISLGEGFGLAPLEAMALGTCVVGLDGLGGRDYLHSGNSFTCSGRQIERLPGLVAQALGDEAAAEAVTAQAALYAQRYTLSAFQSAWRHVLTPFLQKAG